MRYRVTMVFLATVLACGLPGEGRAQFDDIVLRGAWEYHEACAVCHGGDGKGGGTMGEILKVPPSDLTTLSERNGGTFPFERVFRVIDGRLPVEGHGSADMPVWGRTFRHEALDGGGQTIFGTDPNVIVAGRIYALAKYLRAIQGGETVPLVETARPRRTWPRDIPVWPDRQ